MNKKFFLLVFLLLSTFAFSQTTVTLEDQCNCEVLSGTDVNAPGVSTPSGADIGDIYVNTNTGVIYFWDGNSWELTSTDNQQIQAFNFNTTTSQLTLTLENGGTSSVDLSSLRDAFSETLTTLVANADGTFTYTDEDGVDTVIDIANLETLTSIALNADNTNIDYTDEAGVVTQLDLSNIVANLEALTTLVANADGTFTYTDEDGVDTVIDIANLETLTSIALNADNTNIDYTDEAGVVTQLDLSNIVANLEALTTLVANADGTFTYTDEDGAATIIDIANLETLTSIALNADNTNIDYTDEDGMVTQLDLSNIVANLEALTTLVANADGTFTYTDEDGVDTVIDIANLETLTSIALNADNTNIDYTDEDGTVTQLDLTNIVANLEALTTLVANADGTFTYTDEDGVDTVIDIANLETLTTIALNADNTNIDYTDEDGVVTQLDLSNIVANLETLTTLVANADGTFTYTDEDGVDTVIDIANLETLTSIALNADNTNIDYTDEDGVVTQLDLSNIVANLEALTTLVANTDGTFTYTDEDGVATIIDVANLETLTTIALNADNTNIDYTDEDGTVTQLDLSAIVANLETLTNFVNNNDGTITYTNEAGTDQTIDLVSGQANNDIQVGTDGGLYLNVASVTITETITSLVDNNDGTFSYENENGVTQTINKSSMTVVGDGTFTFNNGDGTPVTFVGTDNQALTLEAGNILTLEDGGTVNLDGFATDAEVASAITASEALDLDKDATNELSDLDLTNNILTLTNAAAGATGVDLSAYVSSDDQNLTSATITSNILTIAIENGDPVTVDLSGYLDNTDDQNLTSASIDANSILTIAIENGDPVTVDLSGFINTDNQTVDTFSLSGTTINLSLEDDGEADQTLDLGATFATDAEVASAITASEALDLDKIIGNEIIGVTSGNTSLVRAGSGTAAAPYTLAVNAGGITVTELADNSVTSAKIVNGTIATVDVASGGNDKVLSTNGTGVVEWVDKTALIPATTVSNTSASNTLTTTVNGTTGAGVNIINSNALSLTGTNQLISTVNGVSSLGLNLSSFLDNTDNQATDKFQLNGTVFEFSLERDGLSDRTINFDSVFATDAQLTASDAADGDKNIGNELVTSLAFDGTVLTLNEASNTPKTVNISSVNTDNQKADVFSLVGTTLSLSLERDAEAAKTVSFDSFATDAELASAIATSEASDLDKVIGNEVTGVTSGNTTLVRSGSGTAGAPYTLAVNANGITTNELANNAVTGAKILDGTIVSGDLASNSVTSAKIVDGTIVASDLANNSVTSAKIVDGTIVSADIANNAVTPLKIDASIAGSGIARSAAGILSVDVSSLTGDGTISSSDLVVTGGTNAAFNNVGLEIAAGAVSTAELADNAVTSAKIVDGTIASVDIANDAVTLAKLANGTTTGQIMRWNGSDWILVQESADSVSTTAVDSDGDGTNETNLQQVVNAIAPITAKAARIFYPPSIAVDASTTGTGRTINLYTQYTAQFATPAVASTGAPAAIPTYAATELYYYVTYFDPAVFSGVSVNASGVMTYNVIASPTDYNSLINVVFVVK